MIADTTNEWSWHDALVLVVSITAIDVVVVVVVAFIGVVVVDTQESLLVRVNLEVGVATELTDGYAVTAVTGPLWCS